jgi:hypothetical protein
LRFVGLQEAKNLAGKALRLIEDRLSEKEFGRNLSNLSNQIRRKGESPKRFQSSQLCVNNQDPLSSAMNPKAALNPHHPTPLFANSNQLQKPSLDSVWHGGDGKTRHIPRAILITAVDVRLQSMPSVRVVLVAHHRAISEEKACFGESRWKRIR